MLYDSYTRAILLYKGFNVGGTYVICSWLVLGFATPELIHLFWESQNALPEKNEGENLLWEVAKKKPKWTNQIKNPLIKQQKTPPPPYTFTHHF